MVFENRSFLIRDHFPPSQIRELLTDQGLGITMMVKNDKQK